MATKTYSPVDVAVIYGGAIISGFADGTFITVSRDEDAFMKKVGADGEVARARNANRSGSVTLTLLQSSASNDVMAAFHAADSLSSGAALPLLIKDNSGRTLVAADAAWVKKEPDITRSKEIETVEWVLDCGQIVSFIGGH